MVVNSPSLFYFVFPSPFLQCRTGFLFHGKAGAKVIPSVFRRFSILPKNLVVRKDTKNLACQRAVKTGQWPDSMCPVTM